MEITPHNIKVVLRYGKYLLSLVVFSIKIPVKKGNVPQVEEESIEYFQILNGGGDIALGCPQSSDVRQSKITPRNQWVKEGAY